MRLPVGQPMASARRQAAPDAPRRSLGQVQQPQARPVALLGMGAVLELPLHHGARAGADVLAPVQQPPRRPLQVLAVRFGMCSGSVVIADLVAAHVRGDAAALEEALDRRVGETRHDVLADQRVRHAVVMPVDLDVIVDADLRLGPLGVFVAGGGSGFIAGRSIDSNAGRGSRAAS